MTSAYKLRVKRNMWRRFLAIFLTLIMIVSAGFANLQPVSAATSLAITTQPVDKELLVNSTAKFTVAATGEGPLMYQWQYRKNASSSWANSGQNGAKTATLLVSATAGLHGYQFRCIVTDKNGQTAVSKTVTLKLKPRITTQPVDKSLLVNSTAKFSVEATGAGTLTYQWQFRKNASSAWADSGQNGAKTANLLVSATAGLHGYQFRCIITDKNGQKSYSNTVTLSLMPRITTQPVSKTAAPGTTAKFTVAATGKSTLTYQWQYRKNSSAEWANSGQSGNKTATLSVTVTSGLNGYQFRCVVTDGNGQKTNSSVATLYTSPRITTQPANKSVAAGSTAKFTVVAAGEATLTYQWQFRKNSSATWANSSQSGNKTATLSVAATAGLNGYQFRCVIKDGSGRTAYTSAATLSIIAKITTQPASQCLSIGSTASFTVAATGTGTLTYQWQYMSPTMTTWADSGKSGNKTEKLTLSMTAGLHGYQFRCVITDGNGNKAYSNAATLTLCDIPINATYFPDAIFRKFVSDNFDTVKDGTLSKSEIQAVKTINVRGQGISSLKGVELFTKLEYLNCGGDYGSWEYSEELDDDVYTEARLNQISKLPLNCLTELTYLDCGRNRLSTLDVSHNTKLETLKCEGLIYYDDLEEYVVYRLKQLDVSKNILLKYLDCAGNDIESLDVSKNTLLETLDCRGEINFAEYFGNVRSLDVSNNTKLVSLDISLTDIDSINLSNNKSLKYLYCDNLEGLGITSLDVSNHTALEELSWDLLFTDGGLSRWDFDEHEVINLRGCSSLRTLRVTGRNFLELDVSGLSNLREIEYNGCGKDVKINASGCVNLEKLECTGWVFWNTGEYHGLSSLNVSGCRKLEELHIGWSDDLKVLNVSGLPELKVLEVDCCHGLQSFTLSNLSKLEDLSCTDTNLKSLNLTGCTALEYLSCWSNSLTALDVSGCTALKSLDCSSNSIAALNVSGCTALESLDCSDNSLATLNVSSCTALKYLYCRNNSLTTLNMNGCKELEYIDCQSNNIITLNVSGCTALESLSCSNNSLTTLNVSGCTALVSLSCSDNSLATLNLGGCTALETLSCSDNNLVTLNLNGCTALGYLDCQSNNLTTLNVSGYTALYSLSCSNNSLTTLNVSGCTALIRLYCDENSLNSLNVSGCTALASLYCDKNGMSKLNVSGCAALYYLYCCNNSLTTLNVSGCVALSHLYCYNNGLTTLNINGCAALKKLICYNNSLTALNVSGYTELQSLDCSYNGLTTLNVSGCTELAYLDCEKNNFIALNVNGCTDLQRIDCDKGVTVSGAGSDVVIYYYE